jgi:HKD family nuclease
MNSLLITNEKEFGDKFDKQFSKDLASSKGLLIASGYFGNDLVSNFEKKLVKLGKNGPCKLLIGMIYHSGVRPKQLETLKSIDKKLRETNPDNGIYIRRKKYHGKIYKFSNGDEYKIYVGSSNFSNSGFDSNTECNVEIDNKSTKKKIDSFLEYLFHDKYTEKFSDVELFLKDRKTIKSARGLRSCLIDSSKFPHDAKYLGIAKLKLRVDKQTKAGLNLFYGVGRKNPVTGKCKRRDWYEVEITSKSEVINSKYYPENKLKYPGKISKEGIPNKSRAGQFTAYAKDDGKYYRIDMRVGGSGGKDIYSSERIILGELIKGKLERANVLSTPELITLETLSEYGKDTIDLIKIADNEYIIDF